jgi:hypothetical protein
VGTYAYGQESIEPVADGDDLMRSGGQKHRGVR